MGKNPALKTLPPHKKPKKKQKATDTGRCYLRLAQLFQVLYWLPGLNGQVVSECVNCPTEMLLVTENPDGFFSICNQ